MSDQPEFSAFDAKRFRLDIQNRPSPIYLGEDIDVMPGVEFSATFAVDAETYVALSPEPLYTVRVEQDTNPWHREAKNLRPRLRKLRDGLWFTFRKRILRRSVVERVVYTIPNCELKLLEEGPADTPDKDRRAS